ncbi:hypothetical protein [Stigmatella aurantiaca]|uniref:Ig-like domain-containing protein n=1 Tax=Stigmatella aurantiaca (strain DW4/3-1) TaxID=378806 RepID=Q09AL5_STIAD|nr:hypothetical protein [Stigmatella aurantiaca]ADO74902.1 uncharacterized protein STAUR_7146 [Stigmatella aurantiaca DW4/3-1]EAU68803.1 conserved hypothetical protein [Stigmatella aurantiaca DW4/3-1]
MIQKALLSCFAVLVLSGALACSDPEPGTLTFDWSFEGRSCSQEPDIQEVRLVIPGVTLDNGGRYPCVVAGDDGITLDGVFEAGTYSYVIDAVDESDRSIYSRGGDFTVDGDTRVEVDLASAR